MKARVCALAGQQLIMGSDFDDGTVVHHDNTVSGFDGRQSVSNDQGRTPGHECVESILHLRLGAAVQGTRRLIQQQDARVSNQGPGNSEPLPLPTG